MIGRKQARESARETAEVLEAVADDRKLRSQLSDAVTHGLAARKRANRLTGFTGAVYRLSSDPELRRHLQKMAGEFDSARSRLRRRRSHKLRNTLLVTGGVGAAALAALPQARTWLTEKLSRNGVGPTHAGPAGLTTIEERVEVDVPLSTAYNQWTQFEDFPLFMEGVEDVRQFDDTTLHWVASVGGKRAEWDAKIVEQEPDTRIAWESLDGKETRGVVSFDKLGENRTAIRLAMTYRPEGPLEKIGSAAGLDRRRIRGDLERFKELIESRGAESGAWRGEIHSGRPQ
jgi:uncharacterized membrane protein